MLYNKAIEAAIQRIQNVPLIDEAQRRARDGEAELQSALAETSARTGIRTSALQGTDLRDIPFPDLQYYTVRHGFMVSQLADTIGRTLGLTENDLTVVRTAGLYHDIGRAADFRTADPKHNERSAEIAHSVLVGRRDGHGDRDFIHKVCGLIARHTVGSAPTDPLAQALHDADGLEVCRFEPGTTSSLLLIKKRQNQMVTEFGRSKDVFKRMMSYHGW